MAPNNKQRKLCPNGCGGKPGFKHTCAGCGRWMCPACLQTHTCPPPPPSPPPSPPQSPPPSPKQRKLDVVLEWWKQWKSEDCPASTADISNPIFERSLCACLNVLILRSIVCCHRTSTNDWGWHVLRSRHRYEEIVCYDVCKCYASIDNFITNLHDFSKTKITHYENEPCACL